MKAIDLFSGCGGLSLGFVKCNFEVIKAVEYDESIANTYKQNHDNVDVIVDDIRQIDIEKEFIPGMADVIIGGPPCQGFSMAGARIRKGFIDDPRNYLFKYYCEIVKRVRPKIFIMENVKGILTMHKGKIFQEIANTFRDTNYFGDNAYNLSYKVVNAINYGIPQNRERVIIVGVLGKEIDLDLVFEETKIEIRKTLPEFFEPVTIWGAISNLQDDTADGEVRLNDDTSIYQEFLSSKKNRTFNHIATKHNKKAVERMTKIKSGENWTVLDEDIKSVHSGSYGRLSKSGYAPTITTRFDTPSGGGFIHPIKNRTITLREAARVQSFPDDFIFYGSKSSICRQIGNAVPPKLSFFLACLTRRILNEY